ncbi:hypothetical protein [Xanthomonas rydalmerensis]|uniref:Uncharacterized protein n=1 Tax=Xanthomonas rydalmerensis TaxID=3046274 RepID=A0ABZ0JP91_9XANT|nr:hypothetical protein [Xanthomonas sp. DM-2023]WOS40799.1 hypothetical protein QN243_20825 [Xanthomonas sp. DM-2023]WOS44983.1 hypothetical protein QN242_20825 [Xanthomonas sp. DM-2023]WOS49163.1 hypothetical protein QN240_20825 [Xanthomonas sp. DM-2023]WOS53343.1 hypothetical protein QN244_20830 [Xanthomonas sp. DM-2023]WOS57526.1 hypothetical protein QN245_20825 [Xanthomonas sp. DM-2023]
MPTVVLWERLQPRRAVIELAITPSAITPSMEPAFCSRTQACPGKGMRSMPGGAVDRLYAAVSVSSRD